MTVEIRDYIAAGYFLSRWTDERDCTGTTARRVSMGHDHSQRRFFPETWTLPWCNEDQEDRVREAAVFGIPEADLGKVMAWAKGVFDSVFGAWDLFFKLDDTRGAARSFLRNAPDLELWGVGLHRSLAGTFCERSAPPPAEPGRVYVATALHRATCMSRSPLASGGTPLGHEVLIVSPGRTFNSPGSLHMDESELLADAGVISNVDGLIDSLDDALACCRLLDPAAAEARDESDLWLPWLIVRYAL